MSLDDAGLHTAPRIAFCDVTGATNERTALAAIIGKLNVAGNSVPTLSFDEWEETLLFACILNSFVGDYLLRQRVHTHLNLTYLSKLVVPFSSSIPESQRSYLAQLVARLSCTTPELADAWNAIFPDHPWTYRSAERDSSNRAKLRAELDAIVADLYRLSVPEYASVLIAFPLLDRDQPPLPGDMFVTESSKKIPKGKKGIDWEERSWGLVELKSRSFITRDLALLTYMQQKEYPPPQRLDLFFRDEVGIDPEGPLSKFRIGQHKDLLDRVHLAREQGAIAYIPSGRS